jgi:hypothetical protein
LCGVVRHAFGRLFQSFFQLDVLEDLYNLS